jgi:hypothetical protein
MWILEPDTPRIQLVNQTLTESDIPSSVHFGNLRFGLYGLVRLDLASEGSIFGLYSGLALIQQGSSALGWIISLFEIRPARYFKLKRIIIA